ncbi:MAG: multiheme c-type cytochrome [Acidiferrobacterales bacterium]
MSVRAAVIWTLAASAAVFLGWRMLRPLEIFSISERFENPLPATPISSLGTLSARHCGSCHQANYHEWGTTIHSRAWSDSYFQTDWRSEGRKQICLECHTPLATQQRYRVRGYHGGDRWDPVLAPNPAFNRVLRRQGVTCAACHVRHGVIYGPFANVRAPHPVARWNNDNEACVRCHVVNNRHRDVFYRLPPCGTVTEIARTQRRLRLKGRPIRALLPATSPESSTMAPRAAGDDGYGVTMPVSSLATLNCVECHMPLVNRPLVSGGRIRPARRHLWRGGHDPRMVRAALKISFAQSAASSSSRKRFKLTLTNTGAEHYIPTGVPDRHLTVELRVLNAGGRTLKSRTFTLERKILWRPFIVELGDTRLRPMEPRTYSIGIATGTRSRPAAVEAVVRYWLMDKSHRAHLHYGAPISYVLFRRRIQLAGGRTSGAL